MSNILSGVPPIEPTPLTGRPAALRSNPEWHTPCGFWALDTGAGGLEAVGYFSSFIQLVTALLFSAPDFTVVLWRPTAADSSSDSPTKSTSSWTVKDFCSELGFSNSLTLGVSVHEAPDAPTLTEPRRQEGDGRLRRINQRHSCHSATETDFPLFIYWNSFQVGTLFTKLSSLDKEDVFRTDTSET